MASPSLVTFFEILPLPSSAIDVAFDVPVPSTQSARSAVAPIESFPFAFLHFRNCLTFASNSLPALLMTASWHLQFGLSTEHERTPGSAGEPKRPKTTPLG